MAVNYLEMSNGTKYRVPMELDALVKFVDEALKSGGLMSVPLGYQLPGHLTAINPQHVVAIVEH
jgi:hypothetical protein